MGGLYCAMLARRVNVYVYWTYARVAAPDYSGSVPETSLATRCLRKGMVLQRIAFRPTALIG